MLPNYFYLEGSIRPSWSHLLMLWGIWTLSPQWELVATHIQKAHRLELLPLSSMWCFQGWSKHEEYRASKDHRELAEAIEFFGKKKPVEVAEAEKERWFNISQNTIYKKPLALLPGGFSFIFKVNYFLILTFLEFLCSFFNIFWSNNTMFCDDSRDEFGRYHIKRIIQDLHSCRRILQTSSGSLFSIVTLNS